MKTEICIAPECNQIANGSRHYCIKHYLRWRRHGDTTNRSAATCLETRLKISRTLINNPVSYWTGKTRGHLTAEWRDKISKSNLGKVGYWFGKSKPHSESTKQKISEANKGQKRPPRIFTLEQRAKLSKTKLGHTVSAATRRKLSASIKRIAKHGKDHHRWAKSPVHPKRLLYNGQSFRSSYEVRFAKALDARRIAWKYEPRRFNLGAFTYTPDFYLPRDKAYWEIKGWYDPQSKRKVELFREQNPGIPLVLANKSILEMMEASQ